MSYDTTGIEYFSISNFKFTSGETRDIKVAYRSFHPTSPKTVLIPTCYCGRINNTLNFTSGALKEYNVVVVAMLGNGESSSPSNDNDFPKKYSLRYQDCINSQYTLLTQHLGVKNLEAVIGFWSSRTWTFFSLSFGYCPFLRFCDSVQFFPDNAAPNLSIDERLTSMKYAAWLTSAEWYRQELWRTTGAATLQDYLYPKDSGHESWDPLVLARMWQAGDVGVLREHGDYQKALEEVTARVLMMPSQTDQYFPPEDGEKEVKYLKNGIFDPIPTIWGHIAGGGGSPDDLKFMDEKISTFLGEGNMSKPVMHEGFGK